MWCQYIQCELIIYMLTRWRGEVVRNILSSVQGFELRWAPLLFIHSVDLPPPLPFFPVTQVPSFLSLSDMSLSVQVIKANCILPFQLKCLFKWIHHPQVTYSRQPPYHSEFIYVSFWWSCLLQNDEVIHVKRKILKASSTLQLEKDAQSIWNARTYVQTQRGKRGAAMAKR